MPLSQPSPQGEGVFNVTPVYGRGSILPSCNCEQYQLGGRLPHSPTARSQRLNTEPHRSRCQRTTKSLCEELKERRGTSSSKTNARQPN